MQSTSVREIKEAIRLQAVRGTRHVSLDSAHRVIDVKTVRGQLQVRLLGSGKWTSVSHVNID
jgi:hypothetical protein